MRKAPQGQTKKQTLKFYFEVWSGQTFIISCWVYASSAHDKYYHFSSLYSWTSGLRIRGCSTKSQGGQILLCLKLLRFQRVPRYCVLLYPCSTLENQTIKVWSSEDHLRSHDETLSSTRVKTLGSLSLTTTQFARMSLRYVEARASIFYPKMLEFPATKGGGPEKWTAKSEYFRVCAFPNSFLLKLTSESCNPWDIW